MTAATEAFEGRILFEFSRGRLPLYTALYLVNNGIVSEGQMAAVYPGFQSADFADWRELEAVIKHDVEDPRQAAWSLRGAWKRWCAVKGRDPEEMPEPVSSVEN